jgi:hypothetical protein
LNPETQVFHFQVLYDDVLGKSLSVGKKGLGVSGKGPLTLSDVNGSPLQLPNLVFPFRKALYIHSYYAYRDALRSKRPHLCATNTDPTEDGWKDIRKACATMGSAIETGLISDELSDNLSGLED